MKNTRFLLFSLALFSSLLLLAQDGTFDTSFGNDGVVRFNQEGVSTRGTDLLILNNNAILLGVNSEIKINGATYNRGFYIYKILENGELDTSFGQEGYIYFANNGNNSSYFHTFKLVNENKILVKCSIEGSSKLIQIDTNGVFDSNFGNNGIQDIEGGLHIELQSDGKIIVQSQFYDGYNNMYSFSRYTSNGLLDPSFGNNGTSIHDVTDFRFDICDAIAIQADNKIVAVGKSYNNGDDFRASISRFNENGFIDTSFGDSGTVVTSFETNSAYGEFNEVKLFNNKIIAAGNMHYSGGTGGFGGTKPAIIKFNSNGSKDLTFGTNGNVVFETMYNANDRLNTMEIQSNGKIIFGGGASYPYPIQKTEFYIVKLHSDGTMDSSFGENGVFLTDFGNSESDSNYVTDLGFHRSDGILAFGSISFAEGFRSAIVCRLANEFLGSNNIEAQNTLHIYPNPTSSNVIIKSKQPIINMEIYNVAGQLMRVFNYSDKPLEVDLNIGFLQNGLYTLLMLTENGTIAIKKIIKK
ncbi:MAG: hypothetical protein CMC70_02615 [Flavobacteriaceae bacterium]|nr:hypothetical protein [Flavobacteriaceae bacterium]